MTKDIPSCPRCGDEHRNAEMREFERAVWTPSGDTFTHWTICPVKKSPVLCAFISSFQVEGARFSLTEEPSRLESSEP